MSISVIDPLNPAIDRTRKILFQPFDLGKWITLGFCAWLANLGEGGGNFNINFGGDNRHGGQPGGRGLDPVMDWIGAHLALVLVCAIVIILVGLIIGLLLVWLSSRGRFMFLDGVVHNRGAVKAPWREFRSEGNSLFLFRVCLGLASFGLCLLILVVAVAVAWRDIQAEEFGFPAVAALAGGILAFLLVVIVVGCVSLFLKDFVVPIMYLRRIGVMEAWRVFRRSMLDSHLGTFVVYILFKIVIVLVIGMIAVLFTCLTCCIALIPYVGTVILLPLFVFVRAYSVYFIQQFGPEWQLITEEPIEPQVVG